MTLRASVIPALAAMRLGVGAGTWLAPDRSIRIFGMGTGPHQPLIAQLFASRDLAIAIATADRTSTQLRTRALQYGVLIDTLDTIAALRGLRRRTLPTGAAILAGGGAAVFAALGLAGLAHLTRDEQDERPTRAPRRKNSTAEATLAILRGWRR